MRVEGDFITIHKSLLPLSWLYGIGVRLRNILFEMGILHSRSFNLPVISVGNITVGGSGKTPHVEYLIRLLKPYCKVAVLSRGYKRKTRGYVLAQADTTMPEIGDEPFQMKEKYPDVSVAVDANRCHGIDRIITDEETKNTDVVLLDDAFQHRYVKPGINILLVDYHRLIIYDRLLPAGRLREPKEGKNRADMVIVTKCPKDLKPMEYRVIIKAMNLYPYQRLFFTSLDYDDLYSFRDKTQRMSLSEIGGYNILLVTGIASPQQLMVDLKPYNDKVKPMAFKDHHQFTKKDAKAINEMFSSLPSPRLLITTEKDSTRLHAIMDYLSDDVKEALHVLPVKVKFMLDQEQDFNDHVLSYVKSNSRNSILVKHINDNKKKKQEEKIAEENNKPKTISFKNSY